MARWGTVDDPAEVMRILDEIQRNQIEFERIERSRFLGPWKMRRQYRILKINEVLFAHLGLHHEPLKIDTSSNLLARWLRWGLTISTEELTH